jgi:hypothetical protein
MLEVRDLVVLEPSFTDVVKYEPPVLPWLLEYETIVAIKGFLEMAQLAKKALAGSEEKLTILDGAQGAADEFLQTSERITMATQVITAKKYEG